jgi:hypothetical protein
VCFENVIQHAEVFVAQGVTLRHVQYDGDLQHMAAKAYGLPTVAQLVEALRYKPEGRGFDSRWCHWNLSLKLSFRPHCGPGVDSTSNRNEYQEYFLGVKATGA